MFKNYLIVAWRNLARQKGLSFISIFGLALGIACFSLLLLYALNEFGFDGFHRHAAQIYRVYDGDQVWTSRQEGSIFTPMPLGPAMKQDLADVEDYTRYVQSIEAYLKVGNETDRENIAYADPSFFSMFSFRLREGNAATALADMHNIVLTAATAKRLFGTADAVGRNLQIKVYDADAFQTFTVSAMGGFMNNMMRIPPVDPGAIWILVAIAAGVLLIACINFTTLAVGRSVSRAREVGVRKVIGGSRGAIRWQFLVEAYVLTIISAVLGFWDGEVAVALLRCQSQGRTLQFSFAQYPLLPCRWRLAMLLAVGLLAGGLSRAHSLPVPAGGSAEVPRSGSAGPIFLRRVL
jgi:hypothetical protein